MTSDYDPRDLRAIAEDHQAWCRESHHDVPPWVDYILATVRDDDGEEQPDVAVTIPDGGYVVVNPGGTWLVEYPETARLIKSRRRPTRGQFRDLCRGLGIDTEGK